MARRKKNNFITRKGRKLYGAAMSRVLASEKSRSRNRKRKNTEHRDAQHPIHVRQYWQGRRGYMTEWQRAHAAGQKQLFAMNPSDAIRKAYSLGRLMRRYEGKTGTLQKRKLIDEKFERLHRQAGYSGGINEAFDNGRDGLTIEGFQKETGGRRKKNFNYALASEAIDLAGKVMNPKRRNPKEWTVQTTTRGATGKDSVYNSYFSTKEEAETYAKRERSKGKIAHVYKIKQNPAELILVNGAARRGRKASAGLRSDFKAMEMNRRGGSHKRGRRRNSDLYEDFHGHPSNEDLTVYGPDGMPNNTVMLGELDEIYYSPDGSADSQGNTSECLNFARLGKDRPRLASNAAGTQYFIVGFDPAELPRYTPNGHFGYATRVTYKARKDHIEGDSRKHGYWHKLGEETGELPRLCTDGEGLLVFRGGNYSTEPDGIIN